MISKSFEIKDYMIDGAHVNGFWMNLEGREKLTTEIVYAPVNENIFEPIETEKMLHGIIAKCDSFKSQLPENINCEVVFKDLNELTYDANENKSNFQVEAKELDEIRVVYRFYVKYYL
ncbi:hypothetical protein [Methanolobus sp. ZRKC5]|uniref:hypothetical protein n=1 Tax=unclassified Methanolobus TaxID=2629569 RepID=UPI00313E3904